MKEQVHQQLRKREDNVLYETGKQATTLKNALNSKEIVALKRAV